MPDIINLKQKRKAKARVEKEKKATENRQKFGRTAQEKQRDKVNAEQLKRHLEGHKRQPDQKE